MEWSFAFVVNSVLLGAGLAMDAFSVSMANGLNEPDMKKSRMGGIAGVFAGFQFAMPLIGWICVHTVIRYFRAFEKAIPWIALALLLAIGGKMLAGALRRGGAQADGRGLQAGMLLLQGVATSIDALSVGFAIAGYGWAMALFASAIIAAVTFLICVEGLVIGKKFGTKLADKAQILGGVILIAIGIEIFITGIL